jgi:hypothetical protein
LWSHPGTTLGRCPRRGVWIMATWIPACSDGGWWLVLPGCVCLGQMHVGLGVCAAEWRESPGSSGASGVLHAVPLVCCLRLQLQGPCFCTDGPLAGVIWHVQDSACPAAIQPAGSVSSTPGATSVDWVALGGTMTVCLQACVLLHHRIWDV